MGVGELLWLLLETSIRESLFEANTLNEERLGNRASGDFLNTNIRFIKILIQEKHGVDDKLREELLVLGDNFRVQRGLGALKQKVSLFIFRLVTNFDGDFLNSIIANLRGLSVTLDDNLRVHALIDEGFGLFEKLTGGQNNGGGSITDLIVLRPGNVYECFSGRMNDIKEADEGGTIIRYGDSASIVDQLVHTSWTKCGLDDIDDRLASIDVGDDVTFALHFLSTFFEDDDLWC